MTKKKMKNTIVVLVAAFLALGSPSFAAVYNWVGAVNLDWDTPGNWHVTGSTYTWPNEQYAGSRINVDCEEININTGDMVNRFDELIITGAEDGSNEAVLTIDNGSTLNLRPWKDLVVGYSGSSTGTVKINKGTLDVGDDLIVGYSGSSTGTLEIKRGTLNATSTSSDLIVGYSGSSTGTLEIKRGTLNIGCDLYVGYSGSSTGTLEIKNGTLDVGRDLIFSYHYGSPMSTFEVKHGTIDVGRDLFVGCYGISTGEIGSSTVNIGDDLMVGGGDDSMGALEIKSSNVNIIYGNLIVGTSGSSTGTLEIKSSTVNIIGGPWWKGNLIVGDSRSSTATLKMLSGRMVTAKTIFLGKSTYYPDTGESRIFLNGGLLQGEALEFIMTNSLIVYTGGELWINSDALGEDAMLNLIGSGKIDVSGAPDYEVTTVTDSVGKDYTVLRPL